jgi:hypothetical protein
MTEAYDGRQVVRMDLHRRRSVLVRMTADGKRLETARITNSAAELRREIAKAGERPLVVLEATYGWYWGCGRAGGGRGGGASGASAGGQGVHLPPGQDEEGRRGSGRSAADGPTGRGVDRPAAGPGAAGADQVPRPMPTSA